MSRLTKKVKAAKRSNGDGLWSRALTGWRRLWAEIEKEPAQTIVDPKVKADGGSDPIEVVIKSKGEPPGRFTNLAVLKIITWLGASAGGLTILLVVIGFLALSAHDAMLGIPRSIQNNPEYVAVGGLFFGRSIIFLVTSLISPESWIVLGVLIIGGLVLFKGFQRRSRGRTLLITLFSIALPAAEVYGLFRLIKPLQISDLLLNMSVDPPGPVKQMTEAILSRNTTWLGVEYGFLVLLVVAFSIAFFMLEQESRDRVAAGEVAEKRLTFWHVVRVPAFILLIICVFFLPRAYGVLTISNDYPSVALESSDLLIKGPAFRLLLRENDKFFVLYDPASQSIVTIKRDSVTQHRVFASQHVFTATPVDR